MSMHSDAHAQSRRGGQFLGSGTYGCVFEPPINCEGDRKSSTVRDALLTRIGQKEKRVGKVFVNDSSFQQEQKVMEYVQARFGAFSVPLRYACRIDKPTSKDMAGSDRKCTHGVAQGQHQLVYMHGGQDLWVLCTKWRKKKVPCRHKVAWVVGMLKALRLVVHGLLALHEHGIVHNDIKPANILYNDKTKELRLIDWGLMQRRRDAFRNIYANSVKSTTYSYWPPEYGLSRVAAIKATSNVMERILTQNWASMDLRADEVYGLLRIDHRKECADFQAFIAQAPDRWRALGRAAGHKVDIYSLGVTILLMLTMTGLPLDFQAADPKMLQILAFARELLHPDPRLRPSVGEVVSLYDSLCQRL